MIQLVLVLEFGYNKDWLNKANRAQIDDFLPAWPCRFGTIEIAGHTDAVGKEDSNLQLSVNRATAVRDCAGVYAIRIAPLAAGENNQQGDDVPRSPTARQPCRGRID